MEIIPAIDIINGKCVRLTEGDFARQTTYESTPLEVAKRFEDAGFRRLHMVDLDGAKRGTVVNLPTLESVAAKTNLTIDFGGGIKTDEDIEAAFSAGASIVNLGSIAVRGPEKLTSWIERFGGHRILLAADVRDGKISTDGWQENTDLEILAFLCGWFEGGITQAFVTDVDRDGAMKGPNVDLYRKIVNTISGLKLIASGGVSSLDDLITLRNAGCQGAIVGKAIYEDKLSLKELIEFQNAR
jgi:phosphoribosylformimino-5-aminoimidazole carboxamide ribotide isomerase